VNKNINLSRQIYLTSLASMKEILDLISFKAGKDSDEFKYMKKKIMDSTYNRLTKLFQYLTTNKIVKQCPNKCSLRKGYSDCECSGSGFIDF
jgi:hypothetical protein